MTFTVLDIKEGQEILTPDYQSRLFERYTDCHGASLGSDRCALMTDTDRYSLIGLTDP